MKRRLVAFVGIFCIAILAVSVADAGKPVKTPKPPKTPGLTTECILFTGDLVSAGNTIIVGCCPNAGPWPAYEMTLTTESLLDGTYLGSVFMNSYGRNAPYAGYKVQFWTWDSELDDPGDGDYFFEIRGGEVQRDRKNKVLTVTFTDTNGTATGWKYYDDAEPYEFLIPNVSFVLVRTSDLSRCEE